MKFRFSETLFHKLLEMFVLLFFSTCDFCAKTTIVDVLYPDFALMEMPWSQFKPHPQFLPNHRVARTDDKKAPDTDVLYQAWEARAFIT